MKFLRTLLAAFLVVSFAATPVFGITHNQINQKNNNHVTATTATQEEVDAMATELATTKRKITALKIACATLGIVVVAGGAGVLYFLSALAKAILMR